MVLLNYLKDIVNALIKLDQKIGFRGLSRYVMLILFVFAIINFKSVLRGCIELVTEFHNEIHLEKLEKRDQLLTELSTLLAEFRGHCNADRVLFFEYHNSKENLLGIPFKYLDLTLQCTRYGLAPLKEQNYRDINSGIIVDLYNDIKFNKPVYYSGEEDIEFINKYPGTYSIINQFENDRDSSKKSQILFFSIPGYKQPLGIIVIEWVNKDENRDLESIISSANVFLPRVNALIQSKK